ncbi:MAG: metallophosphoesterase [Acetivibrio sp.]
MKKKIDITSYTIASKNLPASFDGCRIGFLADFHNNREEYGQVLLEKIEKEKFDYIFCGGDMIVGSDKGWFESENAIIFLEKLVKLAPVYYSLGNHEGRMRNFFVDTQINKTILDFYKEELLKIGITVLDNEHCFLQKDGEDICLCGLSLSMDYYKRWWNRKKLTQEAVTKALGKWDKFTILLAHNPVYFKTYNEFQADLVLAGHIHGGLVVIPGLGGVISPEHILFPKYDFGYFKASQSQMILSRGLGAHTLPIRMNNPPEIISLVLKRTCDFSGLLVK